VNTHITEEIGNGITTHYGGVPQFIIDTPTGQPASVVVGESRIERSVGVPGEHILPC